MDATISKLRVIGVVLAATVVCAFLGQISYRKARLYLNGRKTTGVVVKAETRSINGPDEYIQCLWVKVRECSDKVFRECSTFPHKFSAVGNSTVHVLALNCSQFTITDDDTFRWLIPIIGYKLAPKVSYVVLTIVYSLVAVLFGSGAIIGTFTLLALIFGDKKHSGGESHEEL